MLAKRRGDHAAAAQLWHEMAAEITENPLDAMYACEQLALYYERRVKNLQRALEFAKLALAKAGRLRAANRDPYAVAKIIRIERQLLNRVTRLQHRIEPAVSARRPTLPLLDALRPAPVRALKTAT
jgi:hypothetical protein